jgi:type 1 fimbriae regulatory protein FimB
MTHDPKAHPHCLRHSCGYALPDKGFDLRTIQEWLGHRSVEMTVRYTRISGSPEQGHRPGRA